MHGNDNGIGVAAICERDDPPFLRRHAQRSNPGGPLVAGGAQHGAGLAYPSQPSISQRQPAGDRQANVDGVRPSGDRDRVDESQPFTDERLAPLGDTPGETRQPVHPCPNHLNVGPV